MHVVNSTTINAGALLYEPREALGQRTTDAGGGYSSTSVGSATAMRVNQIPAFKAQPDRKI